MRLPGDVSTGWRVGRGLGSSPRGSDIDYLGGEGEGTSNEEEEPGE